MKRTELVVVLLLSFCQCAWAQVRGGIRGQVRNEGSGDAVPFALVKLLEQSDGALVHSVTADHRGNYYFGALMPGTYSLLAQSQGFSYLKLEKIPLREGDWLEIHLYFPGETYDHDTLTEQYAPTGKSLHTSSKNQRQPKEKPKRKTPAERRLERMANRLGNE